MKPLDRLDPASAAMVTRRPPDFTVRLPLTYDGPEEAEIRDPETEGGTSVSEAHISSITDSIILLRYVEIFGEMRRGLAVLKMRGSMHQEEIREFIIDNTGMHIGPAFRNVLGILSGRAIHATSDELGRLDEMFQDGPEGSRPTG